MPSPRIGSFCFDSLRVFSEILQYCQGEQRMAQMNKKTDELSKYEGHMKRIAGRNTAATNTVILVFDLSMLSYRPFV